MWISLTLGFPYLKMAVFLLLLFLSALPACSSHYSDQHALLAFKDSISLDPFNSLQDWSPNHTTCNWTGVICSSLSQRVVSLNLTGMALVGTISPLIGNLSFLEVLKLSKNELEGSIASTLGDCRSLKVLLMSHNYLSGSIPSELGLLSQSQVIRLGSNQLTGTIPSFVGNLSCLTALELTDNLLHGGVPAALSKLADLQTLLLSSNNLTGPIPVALSNCTRLQNLTLAPNYLTGHIPWQFGKLSELRILYLWGNTLTREIPTSLSNCSLLQRVDLGDNLLSGPVPVGFGKLLQLQLLRLDQNPLGSGSSGVSILPALTNCSYLEELSLSNTDLTGLLPSSVSQLSRVLSVLDLSSNKIEGNIPIDIGNLTKLSSLYLSDNLLNGTIPSTLGQPPNLERLYLDRNNFYGRIPKSLGQAKRLGLLSLSENMLSEKIPESLGDLPQLRELLLDHNQLSGKIPANLGSCITLEKMDLSYNSLSGNIPPEFTGLRNLQFYFNISNNLLEGSLLEMSKMVMVQAIDVSFNHFSGEIPGSLSSCTNLLYFNLSWNAFEGLIPTSLTTLKNIQDIDLTIPIAFKDMKMLQHINLSSNRLTGEVPKGGVFVTLGESTVVGNPGLCGTWIKLQPCSYSKRKQLLMSKKVIVPLLIGITIFIMSLLLLVVSYRRRHTSQAAIDVVLNLGPTSISYEELSVATRGFSDTYLLGIGSFGSVYRGILNGINIAVKVFNLQVENSHQSFSRECNVLKRVRHHNVIKIISACSNINFKAVVLPFMSNGSLERWLYSPGADECRLKLSDRLRLAIEVANGMAYLHHYCFVKVIHCDLKPSNVLLGDDMTAYIADFGISKLLFSMDSLTSTNALKGSMGYIALEYGLGGVLSTKGDVYSYGILLLELLTRRKLTDNMFVEGVNLQKWVGMDFPNKIIEKVDSNLLEDANELEISIVLECLTQFLQVALECTRESPQQCPDMNEIVVKLEKIRGAFL